MKIDIPEDIIVEMIMNQLPNYTSPLSHYLKAEDNLKQFIAEEILNKYADKIEWPEITKEEIKDRMLDILAERAIDKIDL